MGLSIEKEFFGRRDYARFERRLEKSIHLLEQLALRPGFGAGPRSIGAELEMSLISEDGTPANLNLELMEQMNDPRFTAEIDRFNLEFNSPPLTLADDALDALGEQLLEAVGQVRIQAARMQLEPIMVGILPSLQKQDLGVQAMTPVARYRVLNQVLKTHRGRPFYLNINGENPLKLRADDVTYEGANTSFQLHLKVHPAEFVSVFNASQLALGPVLAAVGNSPYFLGHRLWEETRIVVFKQAVDDRTARSQRQHVVSRVGLGMQWWEGDAVSSFARHLRSFDVLMPICSEDDLDALPPDGSAPDLAELRTHNGTIWHWNRPVYDAVDGGHLRIEFRALPSGPSVTDMLANAAWMLGLSMGLSLRGIDYAAMPFSKVEFNMYRAAQSGLNANLLWPGSSGLRRVRAKDLILELIPVAREGLSELGIGEVQAAQLLKIIQTRVERGQTGARWQHEFLTRRALQQDKNQGFRDMIKRYAQLSAAGHPVHSWPLG